MRYDKTFTSNINNQSFNPILYSCINSTIYLSWNSNPVRAQFQYFIQFWKSDLHYVFQKIKFFNFCHMFFWLHMVLKVKAFQPKYSLNSKCPHFNRNCGPLVSVLVICTIGKTHFLKAAFFIIFHICSWLDRSILRPCLFWILFIVKCDLRLILLS